MSLLSHGQQKAIYDSYKERIEERIEELEAINKELEDLLMEARLILSSTSYLNSISFDWHNRVDEAFQ
jgi:ribosome-associated translation inhibitor RaiA